MRRILAAVALAAGVTLATGAFAALEAGGAQGAAGFSGRGEAVGAEPWAPVSPIDPAPQPQPIWIIRIPI